MQPSPDSQPGLFARQQYETAKVLHRQGRLVEAEQNYRAVLQAQPDHFDAMEWLGALYAQTGRRDEAIVWLRKAVECDPTTARLHSNLATALGMAERFDEAIAVYRHSLTLDPRSAVAHCDLGIMLSRLQRDEEAITAFENALALKPDLVAAYEHLGYACSRLGQHERALSCFQRVLAGRPGQADAHLNYGVALAQSGRHEEAVVQFRKVLALRPKDARVLHNLGSSLSLLDDPSGALAAFERALAITSDLPEVELGIGNVLLQLGQLEEARAHFERSVALAPTVPSFHRALADLRHFRDGDPQLVTLETLARNEASLAVKEQIELHFALAKAYDDLQNYDLAFTHLAKANALKRTSVVYDEKAELAAMAGIAEAFSATLVQSKLGRGNSCDVPVFIVGMPRSGTTLVEQIVASHPLVFGGGESQDFGRACGCGYDSKSFDPASLADEALHGIANRYLEKRLSKAPWAKRVTDKLPQNFRHVGLIHLVLPNARIVHIQRNPMDTCLSNYTKLYLDNIGFAYDLGELGRHYRAYEKLMAHWRAVLPEGAMLDVQYEALVDDFESEARRIIAYCGLEWDEKCLAFHETKRAVRTASAAQVRQPIYRHSVGRWRPYKDYLGPLLEVLGNASPEDLTKSSF